MAGKSTAADKGPDNNKRLAALESGVSSLAVALTANGFTIGEGGDPIGAAIGAVKETAKLVAELEESKAKLSEGGPAKLAELEGVIETQAQTIREGGEVSKGLHERISVCNARIYELEEQLGGFKSEIRAAVGELPEGADTLSVAIDRIRGHGAAIVALAEAEKEAEQLRADIMDLEEKLAKALDGQPIVEVTVEPRVRPEQARDVGPTFGQLDRDQLEELLGNSSGEFSIVFSNGEFEVVELEPIAIKPAQLRAMSGRRCLDQPIHVRGGDQGDELHGAALLHDGEQVAYCQFPKPITLERRQERRFDRVIFFG